MRGIAEDSLGENRGQVRGNRGQIQVKAGDRLGQVPRKAGTGSGFLIKITKIFLSFAGLI